jgi:hypothetical protein
MGTVFCLSSFLKAEAAQHILIKFRMNVMPLKATVLPAPYLDRCVEHFLVR